LRLGPLAAGTTCRQPVITRLRGFFTTVGLTSVSRFWASWPLPVCRSMPP